MIFYRQIKGIDFIRLFLICIFIIFFFWSYSPSFSQADSLMVAEKDSETALTDNPIEETALSEELLDKARKSVWRIGDSFYYGTAFAIGSNLFISGFHTLIEVLENNGSIERITLEQEFSSSQLTIKRVIRVSAIYNLVLFETEENVENYLSITEILPQPEDELFILGYPQSEFQELKKTGRLVDHGYEYYTFSVNYSYLAGINGSPVLNQQGQVISVVIGQVLNMPYTVKLNHLQNLMAGDIGLSCSDFIHPEICIGEELENLKDLAEQDGDAVAQYVLALIHHGGVGMAQNDDLAFYWYKKSAEQDYILAIYNLAVMYSEGRGTPRNYQLAVKWFTKSAERDHAPSEYSLAVMYREGKGEDRNYRLAVYWYEQSADQGYVLAQYDLGIMCYKGEGEVVQNHGLAAGWWKKSAEQGYLMAEGSLLAMYLYGKLEEQDFKLVFTLAQKAAGLGNPIAQHILALMYSKGDGTEIDLDLARIWAEESAAQGYLPAQEFLENFQSQGMII